MYKRKKITTILSVTVISISIAVLSGLMITGFKIGWGPFATLRYYNSVTYTISKNKYAFTNEEKHIKGENGMIVGHLYLSDNGNNSKELVIFSHGFATEQWHNLNAAQSLAKAGISVFIFDYCGGSINSASEGKTTDMSILTEKSDLNTVIDAAKKWHGIDPNKICIMGFSQGGLVAALTAVDRDDIYKLCLVYPAFTMIDEIRNTYRSTNQVPSTVDRLGMIVGRKYFDDILKLDVKDIYSYAAKYKGPVYLIHGTADKAVPYQSSIKANKSYQNSQLYLIKGGTHGFVGIDDIKCVKKAYNFFK